MPATDGIFNPPVPTNEPVTGFAPGSTERASLEQELDRQLGEVIEIPCVVGGKRIETGRIREVTNPSDHAHVLARAHLATPEIIQSAIKNSLEGRLASR